MYFSPYVIQQSDSQRIKVTILPAQSDDLRATRNSPFWQTDWTSAYLSQPNIEKYAMKTPDHRLIALGAYQVVGQQAYVLILYVESAPESNPTLTARGEREFLGIGEAMIAFGIKWSIDNGCRGDVVFEAKTEELARHYATDFHAKPIPSAFRNGPRKFLLADEAAWALFSKFLSEEE